MTYKMRCLCCLVPLCAGVVGVVWYQFAGSTPQLSRDDGQVVPLQVEQRHLDFGTAWETDRFEWRLPVFNTGSESVSVTGVAGSCECAILEPQQFTLGPNERIELRVIMDLRAKANELKGYDSRPFRVTLMPLVQQGTEHKLAVPKWELTGKVRTWLRAPKVAELGSVSELGSGLFPKSIQVQSVIPLQNLRGESEPGSTVNATVTANNATGKTFTVVLSEPMPQTPKLGTVSGLVTLEATSRDGTMLPSYRIPFQGAVVPDIHVEPTDVMFPARPVGATLEEELMILSRTGANRIVDDIVVTGTGITVTPGPDATSYRVRMHITKPGEVRGQVTFRVRGGGRMYHMTVPVVGIGVE